MKTKCALGLVALSMACIGGPMELRPGSNVVLPKKSNGVVGAVLSELACSKRKDEGERAKMKSPEDAQCALKQDSVKLAPPVQPATRP